MEGVLVLMDRKGKYFLSSMVVAGALFFVVVMWIYFPLLFGSFLYQMFKINIFTYLFAEEIFHPLDYYPDT